MAGGWGAKENGARAGAFWDSIEVHADGSKARIVGGKIRVDRPSGFKTSGDDNVVVYEGASAYVDKTVNLSGSGVKDAATLTAQWIPLTYGGTQTSEIYGYVSFSDSKWSLCTFDIPVVFPARAWQLPTAPTGLTCTRSSDASHLIKWTRTATTIAPWTTIYVERRTLSASGWSAWTVVATLAGTTTQWTDTGTVANRGYQWRVRASNSSGYGPYVTGTEAYTTPAAPTGLAVVKSGTTVTVSWTNAAVYQSGVRIQWAQNGVWGTEESLTATTTSKVYTVDPAKTHQYRVRAHNGLYSTYATSAVVTVTAPPLAPVLTVTPAALDATLTALVASWVHTPTDSTAQVGYKLRYRLVGAGVWTELTGTTATTRTLAAGTLTNGQSYELQACTRGDNATYGPWSASKIVTTAARPVVTITPPAPGVSRLDAAWSFAGGTAQAAWTSTLYGPGSVVIEQLAGTGATGAAAFAHVLDDATTYTLGVTGQDGLGIWSAEATATWTTDLLRPPTPTLLAEFDPDPGHIVITVTTPAADPGQPVPVRVEILRDGLSIGTTDPDGVFLDPIPPTNATVAYVGLAWADPPVSTASAPLAIDTTSRAWVYLNAGDGWSAQARLVANPKVSETIERPKVLHTFAGHTRPTEFTGPQVVRRWRISGEVDGYGTRPEIGDWQPFEDLATRPAPICYRDPLRRIFGSISEVTIDHDAKSARAAVAFTLTEVDYDA